MFPWVFGFQWTAGNIIFLGAFFGVVTVIGATVAAAVIRSWKSFESGSAHEIRWDADFEDLPLDARACRHELSGEVAKRTCERGFACGGCEKHGEFIARRDAAVWSDQSADAEPVAGMPIDPVRYYHRGHAWARPDGAGMIEVGLDALGEKLVGSAARPLLPEIGSRVFANGTGWTYQRGKSAVRVLSPVDGIVTAHGEINDGWYVKIAPAGGAPELGHLLHGREVRPWFTREVERLQYLLRQDGIGASLADGGELVDDPVRHSPRGDWESICGEMLLEP